MSILWLAVSVYLVFSAVALWEAEVRAKPGCHPSPVEVCWASLVFALTRPVVALAERLGARV